MDLCGARRGAREASAAWGHAAYNTGRGHTAYSGGWI